MAIVIDVKLTDAKTDTALDRLEKAIAKLNDVVSRMNANLSQAASQTNQIAANMGRAANSAARVRAAQNTMLAVVPPPKQSWESIREGYRSGAAAGDPEAVRKFLQADRELKRMARARKLATGEGDSIQDILMRTRFANVFGMSVPMPLGRDLKTLGGMAGINVGGQFAGIGAKLAPLASAIAPVVLGLTAMTVTTAAFVAVTKEGYQALREFTSGLNTIGGTGAQAGGALLAGSAVGLGAGDIAGLGSRIGSDPIARSVAAKAGIPTLRGYYGDINDAEAGRKALRYIASIQDPAMRRREAIGLGDPRLADFGRLGTGLQNRLLNPSMIGMGEENLNKAARLEGELKVFNQNMKEFLATLAGPGMDLANVTLPLLSTSIKGLAFAANVAMQTPGIRQLADLAKFTGALEDALRGKSGEDKILDELKKQTKGIDKLVDGTVGGGSRAQDSKIGPRGGMNNDALDRAIQARELGSGLI